MIKTRDFVKIVKGMQDKGDYKRGLCQISTFTLESDGYIYVNSSECLLRIKSELVDIPLPLVQDRMYTVFAGSGINYVELKNDTERWDSFARYKRMQEIFNANALAEGCNCLRSNPTHEISFLSAMISETLINSTKDGMLKYYFTDKILQFVVTFDYNFQGCTTYLSNGGRIINIGIKDKFDFTGMACKL